MPPPDELAERRRSSCSSRPATRTTLRALDITDALRKRVEKFGLADRFVIQPTEDLHKTFGDPAPGCAKVLRVRYVIRGVRGEVYALGGPGTSARRSCRGAARRHAALCEARDVRPPAA